MKFAKRLVVQVLQRGYIVEWGVKKMSNVQYFLTWCKQQDKINNEYFNTDHYIFCHEQNLGQNSKACICKKFEGLKN